ncbi:hypothetical protein LTS18_013624 [Coniosporium uncinatum]|uniref:Uncharacterized protein n=1 Tax=Coniosporium uncinatum TaxID=93489 RepID=A0ACC3DI87_9PEZI|nr:hypothetical protein LTS18_013624 [Coniosporium uncinatum]
MAAAARRRSRVSDLGVGEMEEESEPGTPTFQFRIPERLERTRMPSAPPQLEVGDAAPDVVVDDEEETPRIGDGILLNTDDEDAEGETDDEAQDPEDPENYATDVANAASHRLREDSVTRPLAQAHHSPAKPAPRRRIRDLKISKHGIQYPSLPHTVLKKLSTTLACAAGNSKATLSKDTLAAISQASDWFFEQVSEDLASYAEHAGRKTIEESDVVALMKRQRLLDAKNTVFSLGMRFLPRELVGEMRMVPPSALAKGGRGKRKRGRMESIREEEE